VTQRALPTGALTSGRDTLEAGLVNK